MSARAKRAFSSPSRRPGRRRIRGRNRGGEGGSAKDHTVSTSPGSTACRRVERSPGAWRRNQSCRSAEFSAPRQFPPKPAEPEDGGACAGPALLSPPTTSKAVLDHWSAASSFSWLVLAAGSAGQRRGTVGPMLERSARRLNCRQYWPTALFLPIFDRAREDGRRLDGPRSFDERCRRSRCPDFHTPPR